MSVIYLVLLMCVDAKCDMKTAYIADTFVGETVDAVDDCTTMRDGGRAYYKKAKLDDVKVECWDRAKLAEMGYVTN